MERVECVVVGAGVVGLAVAAELARSGLEVIVLEKHDLIGSETSSRNSEVIHAGIYYPTGSLKAQFCVAGKQQLYAHCEQYAIPHRRCGKIIVATSNEQLATIEGYVSQAQANGVTDLKWLSGDEVQALEPAVRGIGGVLSPSTGIVDSHAFMLSLQGELERSGGMIAFNTEVLKCEATKSGVVIKTPDYDFVADRLINCAGFGAPKIASDLRVATRGYYAKGHYYTYAGASPFSHLVYPVAEPGGLGVHVTLDMAGQVKFGPDVRWIDELDYEFDESHFDEFLTAIKAYFPDVQRELLNPGYTDQ